MTQENASPIEPYAIEQTKPQEKPKKKLDMLRERLQANPAVHFAGEIRNYNLGALKEPDWFELVTIIVSPKTPIFDPDELNAFMNNLLPDMPVSSKDAAQIDFNGDFRLGTLYFDEEIGIATTRIEIELDEPAEIQEIAMPTGQAELVQENPLKRRTWVNVYPDPISAADVYSYISAVRNGDMPYKRGNFRENYVLTKEQIEKLKTQYRTATKPNSEPPAPKSILGGIKQLFMRD